MRSGHGIPRATPPPVISGPAGALGGSFASVGISRPLGGIALPGTPQQPVRSGRYPNQGYRYIGPVYYTPNASDLEAIYADQESHAGNEAYHPAYPPPPLPAVSRSANPGIQFSDAPPQPQTVIVNHYYGKDSAPPASGLGVSGQPEPPSDYYLIAYKNRNVIAALAYWLDGDILHYVTAEKAHNQASMALIDLDMTRRLNADREVPFTVPGK